MEEVFTKFIDLQASVTQAGVMVATKLIVTERRAKFRYLTDDAAKIEGDLSLDKLYLNGGPDVYYVHAVESSLGKHCKPWGDDE